MVGECCWSTTGFRATRQGFILKRKKALMIHVVPRDSASNDHGEDGEVPGTAGSGRHSSGDGIVAGPGCQILIKRTAAERAAARAEKVSVQRCRQPLRSISTKQALENNQSVGLEDISVLLAAGSPATAARERKESAASRVLRPPQAATLLFLSSRAVAMPSRAQTPRAHLPPLPPPSPAWARFGHPGEADPVLLCG